LPGLVIAMLARPDQQVTLVESDMRKSLFLNTVRRELTLQNVTILNKRIESIDIEAADVVSARALASLPDLLIHAKKLLNPTGVALFSKGIKFQEELDAATKNWQFECKSHVSCTSPDARVLKLSRIRPRES
ncbi:class I SAM-dependent methyltransferase, partial [Octadecabacter sp.]|nr:class I SAM-dependent methyltransferase [Octadecabacter sp.]